jgi:UDP-GlcNAc:undecaprenyl-phosphate GlcNAc-1-phosphate transferase
VRVYLLLMLVAAAVTFLTTPFARWVAMRTSAISAVRARDVHSVPTPRLGGLAMLIGIVVPMLLASQMPFLSGVFDDPQVWGIVGGAAIVCALGWADDKWDLDWVTKLAGQVLAAGFMALQGVQLITMPIAGVTIASSRVSLLVTVLIIVIAMNAVNFVDGLDGLAAGIVAIAAGAFFLYAVQIGPDNAGLLSETSIGPLIAAIACGICVGFLPHNFHPARIQMGDSGALFLGLLMAAATLAVGGRTDQPFSGSTYFFYAPIFIPFFILGVPIFDTAFAIVRRTGKFSVADKGHLHHRLMSLGHGQRRSVAILWAWTAILSGLVLFPTYTNKGNAVIPFAVLALGVLLYTFFHPGIRRGADAVVEDVLSHPPAD